MEKITFEQMTEMQLPFYRNIRDSRIKQEEILYEFSKLARDAQMRPIDLSIRVLAPTLFI